MHILLLLVILVLLSWSGIPLKVQIVVEAILLAVCIPDLILGFRLSPPFIPTFKRDMQKMLELAAIKKGDIVIDPGCGEGRLVFAASDRGATAIGYEMAIPVWAYAKVRSLFHKGSSIRYGDLWVQDYSKADVVFCYLLKDVMQDFHKKIWPHLKPGCRVVSNAFSMNDVKPVKSEKGIHLYVKE